MLAPAEADLVRRDPALPGLATLLDPEALVAALRRALPGVECGPAQIGYIKYKPGTNCLAAYKLAVAGGRVDIHAKAFARGAAQKLGKARQNPGIPGPLGAGRIALEDELIVVSVFPNDRKVTALHRFTDGESRPALLRELLPARPDLWDGQVENLVYKPERRLVARLSTGGVPRAAIKVYTEAEYGGARRNAQAFQSRGPLRLAPLLGHSDELHILAFEWITGRVLNDALADPALPRATVAQVGAALAELHAHDPAGLEILSRETEAEWLHEAARNISWLCPALAERAEGLARRLAARLLAEPPADRAIHGDFHARQALLTGESVAILDVDRALCGDPMLDAGLFIAHLERAVIRGELPAGRVEPLTAALLEGYRSVTRESVPARVRLYAAVELLRLSARFFRYAEPGWPERTEAGLARAEAIIDDAGL